MVYAIKRGCESDEAQHHEQFIFPARRIIQENPIRHLPDFMVEFRTEGDHTTVSIPELIKLDFSMNSHAFYVSSV